MYYPALMFAEGGGYGFVVPDIPGFTAHFESGSDEAIAGARRVLADHVAALLDAGLELPRPSDVVALRNDPAFAEDFAEAVATILLPVLVPAGRTRRVNVTLDENTLDLIDRSARDRGLTRSAYIAEASRAFATG